ncbi:thiamine diphosphokinase [Bacillus sp. 03113]|uniref:thiamine diphosphokinase n=1 Tax=Bacillus sp. 03113 TaxID=2578211 RepID=UPI001142CDEC|nr:thiamine diphosphokinase [Bacillus sp. 03113]
MDIHIVGSGPEDLMPKLIDFHHEDCIWVGVDRGVKTIYQAGIIPEIAFGDFDSISAEDLSKLEQQLKSIKKYKSEKDETDMELALNWALDQNSSCIRLFGATGGRIDHFLANIHLMLKPLLAGNSNKIYMIDQKNIVYLVGPGTYSILKNDEKKYISFLPIAFNIKGLTLKGFKYPLTDSHIPISSTLCISNELKNDSGTFSFEEGILMVVRSQD